MADVSQTLKKMRSARDHIVRVAALWQAEGLDTSPLAQSLLEIQDAIAEVEAALPRRGEGRCGPGESGGSSGDGWN